MSIRNLLQDNDYQIYAKTMYTQSMTVAGPTVLEDITNNNLTSNNVNNVNLVQTTYANVLNELKTDTINEFAVDQGVTVEGVLLKDSNVSGATGSFNALVINGGLPLNIFSGGEFLPSIEDIGGVPVTHNFQLGQYYRIGPMIFGRIQVGWDDLNGRTGTVALRGFPVTFNQINNPLIILPANGINVTKDYVYGNLSINSMSFAQYELSTGISFIIDFVNMKASGSILFEFTAMIDAPPS